MEVYRPTTRRLTLGAIVTALALALSAMAAAPADAAPPQATKGSCVQAGLGTLKTLGALQAAAQGKVDYSAFADAEEGPIRLDLPEGSFLSLGAVVKLHTTNPELFAWCD